MSLKWYVVRTEPRSEYRAAEALSKQGVEFYLPKVVSTAEGRRAKESPLFPGYLFVKWDKDSAICPFINSSYRIMNWLRIGDLIPDIPDMVMDELKARIAYLNTSNGFKCNFEAGSEVFISSGTFQGVGEIIREAKTPLGRALVLLEWTAN